MTHLLRIDASSRAQGSYSRKTADLLQSKWLESNPGGEILFRNLIDEQIPHINEQTITGFYTEKEDLDNELIDALSLSDQLIKELVWADSLLISTPMYNFSVPSVLKAYIDQIVRIGHTFSFDPEKGLQGLLKEKKAYIVTASGAVFSDGSLDEVNFLSPYLKSVLGLIGISDVHIISIEGTTTNEDALNESKISAAEKIETYFSI